MTDVRAIHVDEPKLLFGHGQRCEYVKDGLFSFGPLSGLPGGSGLRFGLIGTTQGIRRFNTWAEGVRTGITCDVSKAHRMAWPGFATVFDSAWPDKPAAQVYVDGDKVLEAIRRANRHEAVFEAVGIYESAISQYLRREEIRPDFWFVVIDEEIYRLGTSRASSPRWAAHGNQAAYEQQGCAEIIGGRGRVALCRAAARG